jgi:hypothetical protein
LIVHRVVEISQGWSSSNAEAAVLLDTPRIRMQWTQTRSHQLVDVHCTAALYLEVSAQDSQRLRPPLSLLLACAYRELVAIAIRKLSNHQVGGISR